METKIQLGQAPWTAEFDQMGGYDYMTAAWRIKDANGRTVAEVDYANWNAQHFDSTPIAETDRIAALIAAAPDLLAALIEAVAELNAQAGGGGDTSDRHYAHLEAAIAKAEGRQP